MSIKPSMADDKLIQLLVDQGLLSEELSRAIRARAADPKEDKSTLEHILATGAVTEEQVAQALAARLRTPYVNLAAQQIDPAVTSLVREEVVKRYHLIPLKLQDKDLLVAVVNPFDRDGLRAIEFATGRTVRPVVTTFTSLRDAIQHAYHLEDSLNAYLDGVPQMGEEPVTELTEGPSDLSKLVRGSQLPPVVKLLNLILVDGIRAGASDIHIESSLSEIRVRYRIDGVLHESFHLPKWVQDPLTARCKVLAKLDITERRVPQDGAIRIRYQEKMIDLRVSSLPTQFGEKVTMRILDPSSAPQGLSVLKLEPRNLGCLRQAIRRAQGMVLVTGPTGSGKTTTLYAMLAETISPARNVVTIENPIEYQLRGVNQVEINEKQGLTFAGTLRSILRQDPDVILVGEIRDLETAEIAIRAAQTGHLVLSTLHTNDSTATIYRLLDLGIDPFLIASTVHLILAQRLVRKVCPSCAASADVDPGILHSLHLSDPTGLVQGRGCTACRQSGYIGREAVFEVMPMSPALGKLIEARAPEREFRRQARADGMTSLMENAISKVKEGITTPEEVLRVVDVPENIPTCPSCAQPVDESFSVCPSCGTSLRSRCAGCGKKTEKEWQTCPYCGRRIEAQAGVQSPPAPEPVAAIAIAGSPEPAPDAASEQSADTDESVQRRFQALVVDDERDFRFLLQMFLEHSGLPIDVRAASNGSEALEMAAQIPPDIVLLDVMMPGMDGFEVCNQLRASVRTAFVPILMLTALTDASSRTRGFTAGTDDYINKPFDRRELLARVTRVLQRTYGIASPAEPESAGPKANGRVEEADLPA